MTGWKALESLPSRLSAFRLVTLHVELTAKGASRYGGLARPASGRAAQPFDLVLQLEHAVDAGEVEPGVEQLPDPDQALDVLLAVAPGPALGAVRHQEATTLVDAEVLDR